MSTLSCAIPSTTTATIGNFFYFFYGVPILVAISLPEKERVSRAFFLLEFVQAVAAGYLAYVVLFGSLPFTSIPIRPISQVSLILIFDVQNIAPLALLATARLIVAAANRLSAATWLFLPAISGFMR